MAPEAAITDRLTGLRGNRVRSLEFFILQPD
jgi:hypothetical protein